MVKLKQIWNNGKRLIVIYNVTNELELLRQVSKEIDR